MIVVDQFSRQDEGASAGALVLQAQTTVEPVHEGRSVAIIAVGAPKADWLPTTTIMPLDATDAEAIILVVEISTFAMLAQLLLIWHASVTAVRADDAPRMSSETRARMV